MSGSQIPNEAPPSYQQATNNGTSQATASTTSPTSPTHLQVPGQAQNGIPIQHRRSMEDEQRPLPKGWVRTFDPEHSHQFFVDTTKDPPRSTWVHPYDDDEYLSTLSSEEREQIEQESMGRGHPPSKADIMAAHTDDEDDDHHRASSSAAAGSSSTPADLPPRPGDKGKAKEGTFGRRLKDKVTGTTHEEREQQRARRAQQERQMYEQHLRVRQAMATAAQTGQPQFVGKDGQGKDIYIEPPSHRGSSFNYGGGYGYNPYGPPGIYSTPNARYIRPADPYRRPYGGGYGGGYGLPLMLGGGLLGGMLIGDAMF